jgi:hypothetical protein
MDIDQPSRARLRLATLICAHIMICCVSLIFVARFAYPGAFDPTTFHVFYNPDRLYGAIAVAVVFGLVSSLFVFARFSFGYFVGFYLYTMILGYLWINSFSDMDYNHHRAGFSAAGSAIAFLLPALFICAPVRQRYVLSATAFNRLLMSILILGVAIVAIGAAYNFRFVAIENINDFREKIESPTILKYLIGITSSTLLPFAFAGFASCKAYWRGGAVLILLLLFYPITLSKLALFTPFWLVFILSLTKFVEARTVVVLSRLLPMLAGVVLISLFKAHAAQYFSIVNFRMMTIPAVAMDLYNDFFSRHDLTYFCQISGLKRITDCPYQDPLSIVMHGSYKLGFFNASLFATEGIASVGGLFAPIAALMCGLVFALGNRLSAGLPAGFVLISGAILPQVLLDVPLSTALVTHGAALLFLLWYVTPRTIFEPGNRPVNAETAGDALC